MLFCKVFQILQNLAIEESYHYDWLRLLASLDKHNDGAAVTEESMQQYHQTRHLSTLVNDELVESWMSYTTWLHLIIHAFQNQKLCKIFKFYLEIIIDIGITSITAEAQHTYSALKTLKYNIKIVFISLV